MTQFDHKNVYTVALPEHPEAVVFVNGIIARNIKGWFWLMRHLLWIRKSVTQSPGCIQLKAGVCSVKEVVMVSYWQDAAALKVFFTSEAHRKMMRYFQQHPSELCLYNETYTPQRSGKYTNEPQGMACLFEKIVTI